MTHIVCGIRVNADMEIREFLAPRFYSSCASCLIIVLIAQKAPSQLARRKRHLKQKLPEQCGFERKSIGNYFEEVLSFIFQRKAEIRHWSLPSILTCTWMTTTANPWFCSAVLTSHQDMQTSRKPETCNSKIGVFANTATKVHEGIFYTMCHASGFVPLWQQKSYSHNKHLGLGFFQKGLLFARQVSLANAREMASAIFSALPILCQPSAYTRCYSHWGPKPQEEEQADL